jgi:hypothetical protein
MILSSKKKIGSLPAFLNISAIDLDLFKTDSRISPSEALFVYPFFISTPCTATDG